MISLQDYIDTLLQSQEHYVQLSVRQTEIFKELGITDIITEKYWIESDHPVYFPGTNIILPELLDGSKRLWYKESWEKYNGPEMKKKLKLQQMMKEAGIITK